MCLYVYIHMYIHIYVYSSRLLIAIRLLISPQYTFSYTMDFTPIDYDILQIIDKVVYVTLSEKLSLPPMC